MGNVFVTKKDIEPRFLRPNGIYPPEQLKWDLKTMKKFVLERKVAPFYPGTEESTHPFDEECPICMMYYSGGLNRARCCKKPICTECYFSIRPPGATSPVDCPFCLQPNYITSFTGPLTDEERKKLDEELAKVKELENKMKLEEIERDRAREEERKKKKEEKEKRNIPKPIKNDLNVDDYNDVGEDEDLNNIDTSRMTPTEIEDLMLNEAIRLSLLPNAALDELEQVERRASGSLHDSTDSDLPLF